MFQPGFEVFATGLVHGQPEILQGGFNGRPVTHGTSGAGLGCSAVGGAVEAADEIFAAYAQELLGGVEEGAFGGLIGGSEIMVLHVLKDFVTGVLAHWLMHANGCTRLLRHPRLLSLTNPRLWVHLLMSQRGRCEYVSFSLWIGGAVVEVIMEKVILETMETAADADDDQATHSPEEWARMKEYVDRWKTLGPLLEEQREADVRRSDTFSAFSFFAGMPRQNAVIFPAEPTSGLVQQQQWFQKLRVN